jgi:hypothetical protein
MKEAVSGTLERLRKYLRVLADPPPMVFLARFANCGIELGRCLHRRSRNRTR